MFAEQAVAADRQAMVGAENDDRVFVFVQLFQSLKDPSYVVIDRGGTVRYHAAELHGRIGDRYYLSEIRAAVDAALAATPVEGTSWGEVKTRFRP